jgi:hypothetical protein
MKHGAPAHVFRPEKETYIDSIVRDVLACPVKKEEYVQGLVNGKVQCKPYTKILFDMDYKRYYRIQTGKCNQMDDPMKYPSRAKLP